MHSIAAAHADCRMVVGVDTHKYVHVAVALDRAGGRRGDLTITAYSDGYAALAV
jgi:transposase